MNRAVRSSDGATLRGLGIIRCRKGETAAEVLRDIEAGDSGRPYILENATLRELHFTRHATQSAMLIEDPVELLAPYACKMMAFLLFVPRPHRILMIGLGGGSLVKYCHRHLSSCVITAVESNPEVIASTRAHAAYRLEA